jgi:hypothetical protein
MQDVSRCEKSCKRNCSIDIKEFSDYRAKFWKHSPNGLERRSKVVSALTAARHNYLLKASVDSLNPKDYPNQLLFRANGKEVCEKFFANLLGMVDDKGYKNKRWVEEVDIIMGRKEKKARNGEESKKGKVKSKREHAYGHILGVVESQVMDKSAHANYDNHLYLPYSSLTVFFDEYVYLCKHKNMAEYAQKTTFALAMEDVIEDKKRNGISIRLSNGKGRGPVISCH